MAWQTAAGAAFRMSAAVPVTFDEAGYSALTFDDIGYVTNIGEFGAEYALVTLQPLKERGVLKGKGSLNKGTLNPNFAFDATDTGQQLLLAARESDAPQTVEIELQDGTLFYFRVLVMSVRITVDSTDSAVTGTATLEVLSDPDVMVEPA